MAWELEMSHTFVHNILTEVLGMRCVSTQLVPKQLKFLQKEHQKSVAEDMILQASSDSNFMKRIITGNQTRVS